jgi:tripartite-type tricarboxylate transporter receptor subunit TctC
MPANVPRGILVRLNAEINKAFTSPSIMEKFPAAGLTIVGGAPEQYAEHLRRETVKWAGVIKAAGIKPQ